MSPLPGKLWNSLCCYGAVVKCHPVFYLLPLLQQLWVTVIEKKLKAAKLQANSDIQLPDFRYT
jgi:hypothetical protein